MTNPLLRGLVDLLRPFGARPCVLTASSRTVIMPADLPTLQRSPMPRQRLSSTDVTEHWIGLPHQSALMLEGPDHLAPLFGFLGDEPAKVCGRDDKRLASKVGKPCLHLGIGEARVDLLVELLDDARRRVLGYADAIPVARLIARHELTHGRDVWQRVRAGRG